MQADAKLKHYAMTLLAQVPGEMKHIDDREFQLYEKQMFLYKGTTLYLGQRVPFAVIVSRISNQQYKVNLAQMYYNHLNTFNNQDFWTVENGIDVPMNFYHEMFGPESLEQAELVIGGHLESYDKHKDFTYLDYAKPAMAEFLHFLEHGIKSKIVRTNANVNVLADLSRKNMPIVLKPGPVFIVNNDIIDSLLPIFVDTIKDNSELASNLGDITEIQIDLNQFYYQLLEGNSINETIARYTKNNQPAIEFTLNVNRTFTITTFTPKGKIEQTNTKTLPGNVFRLNQELQKINLAHADNLGVFSLSDLENNYSDMKGQ